MPIGGHDWLPIDKLPFPERSLKSSEPPAAPEAEAPAPQDPTPPAPAPQAAEASTPVPEEAPAPATAQEASESLTVKQASDKPHREKLKTSRRKKSKAVTQATRDMDERQREFDLSEQQRLNLPDPSKVTDADVEALTKADAELAEFEAILSEGQGGERTAAVG